MPTALGLHGSSRKISIRHMSLFTCFTNLVWTWIPSLGPGTSFQHNSIHYSHYEMNHFNLTYITGNFLKHGSVRSVGVKVPGIQITPAEARTPAFVLLHPLYWSIYLAHSIYPRAIYLHHVHGPYNTIKIPRPANVGENLKIALSQPIGERQQKVLPSWQIAMAVIRLGTWGILGWNTPCLADRCSLPAEGWGSSSWSYFVEEDLNFAYCSCIFIYLFIYLFLVSSGRPRWWHFGCPLRYMT
jgi:hypothetical protein